MVSIGKKIKGCKIWLSYEEPTVFTFQRIPKLSAWQQLSALNKYLLNK